VADVQAHVVYEERGGQANVVGGPEIDAHRLTLVGEQVECGLCPGVLRAGVVEGLQSGKHRAGGVAHLSVHVVVWRAACLPSAYVPPVSECS
jgi:hypothetical protein